MPLIAALVIVLGVLWIAASWSRSLMRQLESDRAHSIDSDVMEARLHRMEEAIDALARQVETLTLQQAGRSGRFPPALPGVSPGKES